MTAFPAVARSLCSVAAAVAVALAMISAAVPVIPIA